MNKRHMLMVGVSCFLLIMAWLSSGTGFLSSSVLGASLQSCVQKTVTEKAVCEPLLLAEKKRLQSSIQSGNKKISNKEADCQKYAQQNKQSQLRRCRDAVRDMRQDVRSAQQQLKTVESALAGLTQTVSVTLRQCCADVLARNYDAQCGRDGTSQAQLSTCVYPVTVITTPIVLGCTDMTAINYNAAATQDDGTCQNASLLCMDSLATNFLSSLPCTYFQNKSGCTDRMANNYDSTANINDGSCTYDPACNGEKEHGYDPAARACMTCSDGVKNGDEEDVDCGGKCGECQKGCKDSKATNYNPDPKVQQDNSLCEYDQTRIDTGVPNKYCDVPSAVNYEQHDEQDSTYEASASVCMFCGNNQTDGTVKSDGTVEPVKFVGEVSGTTVEASEMCDEGKDDKPYDGCYMCRIETCADELALCKAYKFTGSESPSSLSSKLSNGIKDNSASKRPEWNNHDVDDVTTRGRDFATFGATCIRDKDKKIVSYTGYRTVFGLNVDGSSDAQDNGFGSPDYGNVCQQCSIRNLNLFYGESIESGNNGEVNTRNKIIRGVAVPKEMLREIFSTDVNYRRVRVDVTGPNGCYRYPIVDEGPNEYTWTRKCSAILDMTYATAAELGLLADTIKPTEIKWKIIENAGEDFRERLTPNEINAGFNSMTFGNTYGYKYRKYTQIDYPEEYFRPTPCN